MVYKNTPPSTSTSLGLCLLQFSVCFYSTRNFQLHIDGQLEARWNYVQDKIYNRADILQLGISKTVFVVQKCSLKAQAILLTLQLPYWNFLLQAPQQSFPAQCSGSFGSQAHGTFLEVPWSSTTTNRTYHKVPVPWIKPETGCGADTPKVFSKFNPWPLTLGRLQARPTEDKRNFV